MLRIRRIGDNADGPCAPNRYASPFINCPYEAGHCKLRLRGIA